MEPYGIKIRIFFKKHVVNRVFPGFSHSFCNILEFRYAKFFPSLFEKIFFYPVDPVRPDPVSHGAGSGPKSKNLSG
jgi:hypothetical protein